MTSDTNAHLFENEEEYLRTEEMHSRLTHARTSLNALSHQDQTHQEAVRLNDKAQAIYRAMNTWDAVQIDFSHRALAGKRLDAFIENIEILKKSAALHDNLTEGYLQGYDLAIGYATGN